MQVCGSNIRLVLIFPVLMGLSSLAQISPGDLAEVHAHLEGISNCTKCHILGQKVADEKCLDCHIELKQRIDNREGYHASAEVTGKECVSCHSDHHGRNFEMIRFDKNNFNHNLTGYELLGAHKALQCDECHKKDHITDPKIKEKDYTYLGLGTDCLSCHSDYHQGTLSQNCTNCHNYEKFKPAPKFDHSNTDFILRGKHRDVSCIQCHRLETRNGKEFRVFAGVPHAGCISCHEDVHENRFGQDCSRCHNEESFLILKPMSHFDHDKTDFPLEGLHQIANCAACHKGKYSDPVRHDRCSDCHPDYHRGQFTREGSTPDCDRCHDTQGFSMSSFTVEHHNKGSFKLEGAHLATPCFACHRNDDRWEFSDIGVRCADCHADIHNDFIDRKYYPDANCTACHSVNSWGDVRFDHVLTGWELTGSHKEISCRECHLREDHEGRIEQKFSSLSPVCSTCHADDHAGQFEVNGETDCTRCHGTASWDKISFDHNTARFILDGKHRDVACVKCHILVTDGTRTYRKYKFEDISCESCHR